MENVYCDSIFPEVSGKIITLLSLPQKEFSDTSQNLSDREMYTPKLLTEYYPFFIFPAQVQTSKFELKKPLPITIEKVEDLFGIYNEELNISTMGETKEEATQNFINFLVQDYSTYKSTPEEKLSEGAKRLLSNYEGWLKDK